MMQETRQQPYQERIWAMKSTTCPYTQVSQGLFTLHTSHTSSHTPPVLILNRVIEVKTQTGQFLASFELLMEWEDQTVCIELDRHAAARPYSHPRHALRSFARRWPRRRQPLRSIWMGDRVRSYVSKGSSRTCVVKAFSRSKWDLPMPLVTPMSLRVCGCLQGRRKLERCSRACGLKELFTKTSSTVV